MPADKTYRDHPTRTNLALEISSNNSSKNQRPTFKIDKADLLLND
jgi:hypothetical protein